MSRRKYGNRPGEVDGRRFDSQKEASRYGELCLLRWAGKIRDLECQPEYPLVVNGVKVGLYRGDFRYFDCETGQSVTEDVKGYRTREYRLKRKLVKALYGIEIREV